MSCRLALSGLLVAAVSLPVTPQPAQAGDAGAFIGGVAAGVLGTLAVQHAREPQRVIVQKHYVAPRTSVSSYQREANRQVQTALNYFGFPAGVPDGIMGSASRAAVAQYQAFLGNPATGLLNDYERTFLTSSYDRAIVGGAATAQAIAAQGQGTRGLLLAYRQEQFGVPSVTATVAVQPRPQTLPEPVAPAAAPVQTTEASAPAAPVQTTEAAAPAAPAGLPSFIDAPATASMAADCNRTSVATSRNGGPQVYRVGQKLDTLQAVAEQFCLARTYAIDDGASLAATAQGFTAAQIEAQCAAFAPSMSDYVGRLMSETPAAATEDLRKFVVGTGIPSAQLGANARICLGVGYGTDNPDVALAAALVLVGLGEGAYDELIAYHLIEGYGLPERGALGVDWLNSAVEALESGATPLVTADEQNRFELLQTTATLLEVGQTSETIVGAKGAAPSAPAAATNASAPVPMALPKAVSN